MSGCADEGDSRPELSRDGVPFGRGAVFHAYNKQQRAQDRSLTVAAQLRSAFAEPMATSHTLSKTCQPSSSISYSAVSPSGASAIVRTASPFGIVRPRAHPDPGPVASFLPLPAGPAKSYPKTP